MDTGIGKNGFFCCFGHNTVGLRCSRMVTCRLLGTQNWSRRTYPSVSVVFGSLVALQIVFELGFSFVILQLASHERAHLTISKDYEITGDPIARSRLASVIQKSVRWYSVAALIMAATLIPVGFYFFSRYQHAATAVSWRLPWCSVALMASLNFQLDPFLCRVVTDFLRQP